MKTNIKSFRGGKEQPENKKTDAKDVEIERLKKLLEQEKDLGPLYGKIIAASPEATGVNVTKTMADAGINLEWPPTKVAYLVAPAGIKMEG